MGKLKDRVYVKNPHCLHEPKDHERTFTIFPDKSV